MRKNLLIITKNVFTQYDYDRFKVQELKKYFNIFCIDCSSLFFKKTKKNKKKLKNYFKIKNIYEFF